MLMKLIPDQISQLWDMIRYALENSPPIAIENRDDNWINNILTQAMNGSISIWASYNKQDNNVKFEGIVITSFEVDKFVKQKSLLIYYVFAFRHTAIDTWTSGLDTLRKYAKSRNCSRILAYSNVPDIIKISEKLGGDVSTTFITFNIGD